MWDGRGTGRDNMLNVQRLLARAVNGLLHTENTVKSSSRTRFTFLEVPMQRESRDRGMRGWGP